MGTLLNETVFEEHIANCLENSRLYNRRSSTQFDIDKLCDREMLERFIQAQPKVWKKLSQQYPGREVDKVIDEYNKNINRGESILTLLRKGMSISGAKVRFMQPKPELEGEDSDNYKLYKENCFSVVRQMRYSLAADDKGNELDLCILVNGLPLMTFELKNEGTSQNYNNGVYQYRYDRNPENRMLRNCLIHFVMDNNYVFMTTKLDGEKTRFLPFNRDSRNPAVEGDYPTCYMWKEILQADSLIDIIVNFFKRYNDENNKPVIIFPRYHQLRAVRMLRGKVREEGAGHNYLIQHSAGSGKTKSMAWLAHQLSNMTNGDNNPIFDSIIMVTDRIVLNRNMADDVVNFQTVPGTVKDIRRGSKNLAKALNEGHRIIISTVQKFAYALPHIKHETQKHYAIIVDEAHTAIGNESAKDIVNALSTVEDLHTIGGYDPADYDDQMDALMAYMQVMRQQMHHLSYFAFTATPKDKTYALFGTPDGKAHDVYSMKQAIDEGFILDVLKYYKSYKTMFELVEKNPDDDMKRLFEEKKALRVIYGELNKNAYIMLRKTNNILQHFMEHTINKIGHRAKAMVVCDSRRAAADYKWLFDRVIAQEYDNKIKTLVAFSGEVEDSHGRKCTEASMNNGLHDDDIRLKFQEDDYKILIVADKYQTGFDQPLLHTMYVDKSLGGIQCIQTLSRLNRCYPGKDDTMVIDFRNDPDVVQKSFQRYYTETTLEGEVDTERMYALKRDVESFNVISDADVNAVVDALYASGNAAAVPSIMKRIVEDRVKPLDDEKKDLLRKNVSRYVRQYGFLAQLMKFIDPDLEKFYIFCKLFYKYLPYTKEVLPIEILELIDLEKLRIQLGFEGMLELEDEDQVLKSSRIGEPGKKMEDEKRTVAEILDLANSPFAGLLDENDKVLKQILDAVLVDPEVTGAFMAGNSYDVLMNIVREKFDEKIAEQIEKYYNFAEVLEKEQGLTIVLLKRVVDAMVYQMSRDASLPYDEERLKQAIIDQLGSEFEDVCRTMRRFDEFVSVLLYVLDVASTMQLDGVNDIVKTSLNNLYCATDLNTTTKRMYFSQLATKWEAYLKKLYYLAFGEEVKSSDTEHENAYASLTDCLKAFNCLWSLKYSQTSYGRRFYDYLEMVKRWRNDESHEAIAMNEEDLNAAVKVVTAMYLFVTGNVITELEMQGVV